jgi:hypothetical protein
MFDLEVHRQPRRADPTAPGQPLWAEMIWLRDWLSEASFGIPAPEATPARARRSVLLAAYLGQVDYARELVDHFAARGILAPDEARRALAVGRSRRARPGRWPRLRRALASAARLAPRRLRRAARSLLDESLR